MPRAPSCGRSSRRTRTAMAWSGPRGRSTRPMASRCSTSRRQSGCGAESLRPAYNALRMHPQVRNVTLMTHFADADGASGVQGQLDRFNALAKGFEAPRSLANSAALIRFPEAGGDWVRPGIMLYG